MDFQRAAELQYQLKKNPNSPSANLDLAKFYLDEGKVSEGTCYLERAVELSPQNELTLNLLGTLYAQHGELGRAEEKFKKALGVNPSSIEAHYNLGLLYYRQNRTDEAIENLREAIRINPQDAEALSDLGALLYKKEMYQEAEIYFKKALEIKPDLKDTLCNLLDYYYRGNDFAKARTILERLLKVTPEDRELSKIYKECQSKIIRTFSLNDKTLPKIRSNIGFVSIWFERGQSYVTKALRDILATQHNTFVFARQGGVYGEAKLETEGSWNVRNLFIYEDYEIPVEVLEKWIKENDLDMVVFNEEYDWRLIKACKDKGVKALTYLDYYKDDWKSNMMLYDGVLCSTKRTYDLVKAWCNAYYIGWGIDGHLFGPSPLQDKKYTFFHNAGWLGINYRKMTPAVILAFDAISKVDENLSLLIHSQVELEKLPDFAVKIVNQNPRIDFRVETVGAPGLYHLGKIYVYPTKLEGLGLTVIEALCCGLPVITTDAPPMNEFVKNNFNGWLVRVAKRITRQDVVAFPEEIVDVNDLALKMYASARDEERLGGLAENARNYANSSLNWRGFEKRVKRAVESCCFGEEAGSDQRDLRLDICGGQSPIRNAFFLDGTPVGGDFLNVDIRDIPGVDVKTDLREKLPFEDNSVLEIFSSGTLEYFNLREIPFILKEFHRVLLPGGIAVICVPNLREIARRYADETIDFETLNRYLYGDQANPFDLHKAVFDESSLRKLLEQAGFVQINSEPFDIKFHIPELMLKVIARTPGEISDKNFLLTRRYNREHSKPERRTYSIVMLVHDELEHTRRAVESIMQNTKSFELVIVDNGSSQETRDYLQEIYQRDKQAQEFDVKYIRNEENLSVSTGWNQGIRACSADIIAIVNNDIVFTSGWLFKMSSCLKENVALVGPMNNSSGGHQVLECDETISYEELNRRSENENRDSAVFNLTDKDFLSGFCMVTRREIFQRIGYFDENFEGFLCEDTDFQRRLIDNGYRMAVDRTTFVYHVGQATMRQFFFTDKFVDIKKRNAEYFAKKHNAELIIDNSYVPRTKKRKEADYVATVS